VHAALAEETAKQRSEAQAEIRRFGLAANDPSQAPVVKFLMERAQQRVAAAVATVTPAVETATADLHKLEAEVARIEPELTPQAAHLSRLYRLDVQTRDSLLRFANTLSESAFVEVARQAGAKRDADTAAALFAVSDAKPEWKRARAAVAALPVADLEVMQQQLERVKGQLRFGHETARAALKNRAIAPEERVAFGLSQGELSAA
jgi:hypothetical protein